MPGKAMTKFDRFKGKPATKDGVDDPDPLAAKPGRKKRGRTAFQKMAAAERAKAAEK